MTIDRDPTGSAFTAPEPGRQRERDALAAHQALAERYRRVVETSNDAIVITDLDRRIAFANPAAIALFGYGPALVGMSVARTVPEELREDVRQREDLALRGEPQRYEGMVVRA